MEIEFQIEAGTWFKAGTLLHPTKRSADVMNQRFAVITDGRTVIARFNTNEPVRIGRDDTCDIILDSKMASRSHCIIYQRKGRIVLQDTSSYGTTINRKDSIVAQGITLGKETHEVTIKKNIEPFELQNDDLLTFGDTKLRMYILGF